MKTNSILLLLCIVLLSSCAGKFGVMKRRYNKGFYVSVSGDRKEHKATAGHKKSAEVKVGEPVNPEKVVYAASQTEPARLVHATPARAGNSAHKAGRTISASAASPANMSPRLMRDLASIKDIQKNKTGGAAAEDDTDMILLVILAIFIPPLAVYLKDKSTSKWFWIVLILSLVGAIGWWVFPFAGLAWLLAVIFAILYVLGKLS